MTARVAKPDRLLEGEDSETLFAQDTRHWIAVYQEMIEFKERLLGRIQDEVKRLPPAARSDVVENDVGLITGQLERYRRRLEYWYQRQWQLEGLSIDSDQRTIAFRDRSMRLTKRELQLFTVLVSRSPNYVPARQLLVDGWHDAALPEETLRTYIARLRAKLATLRTGAEIRNRPRRGYAMVFSEQPHKGGELPS